MTSYTYNRVSLLIQTQTLTESHILVHKKKKKVIRRNYTRLHHAKTVTNDVVHMATTLQLYQNSYQQPDSAR